MRTDHQVRADKHPATVANHQTVAAALIADVEIATVRPGGSRSRHQHAVVGGVVSDKSIRTDHTAPITDRQAITALSISHRQVTSNVQGGIGSCHQHTVIGSARRKADASIGVHHHTPLIRNHQTVASTIIAYNKFTAIRPRRS